MLNLRLMGVATLVVFIYGCGSTAQMSSSVATVPVSVAPYLKMSCEELAHEATYLYNTEDYVSFQVDSEYKSDSDWENIAWIHPFLMAGFDGNQSSASLLAAIKGQVYAVNQAQRLKNCTVGSYGGAQKSIAPVYVR